MTQTLVPVFVGGMGPLEIGIILLLIVVLFGADKIPKLARSAGEAKKEFEKAKMEAEKEIEDYEEELEDADVEGGSGGGGDGAPAASKSSTDNS